jgi:STE24 endopeptidase
MDDTTFSSIFIAALVATTAFKLWLAARQASHVRRHRDRVPADFAERISLSAHQKAADYTVARGALSRVDVVIGAAWILVLTLGGVLQWLHAGWGNLFAQGGIAHGVAFLASIGVLGWLVDLPLSVYRTFVLEARFGFNKMTPALFISDALKAALLSALIGLPVLAAVLWLMQAMGAHWWVWVWLFWMGFNLLVLLVYPTFIAPLFNKFSPLEDARLRERIEGLLARCGFRSSGLFVIDGRLAPLGPWQRLLHRLRPVQAHRVLRHPAREARPARGGGGAGP